MKNLKTLKGITKLILKYHKQNWVYLKFYNKTNVASRTNGSVAFYLIFAIQINEVVWMTPPL